MDDFAQAYNRLRPAEPIAPNQVIEHFTKIARPEVNVLWNKPETLLKFLSDVYIQEKQSVELIQSRELRAAQDAEYEEMMHLNPNSGPMNPSQTESDPESRRRIRLEATLARLGN